jgi:hypothetical protein
MIKLCNTQKKQSKKNMKESGWYPVGAEQDSNAPFNQKGEDIYYCHSCESDNIEVENDEDEEGHDIQMLTCLTCGGKKKIW